MRKEESCLRAEKKWKVLKLIAGMTRASLTIRGVKGNRWDKEAKHETGFTITFSFLFSDEDNFPFVKVEDVSKSVLLEISFPSWERKWI